MSYTWYFPQNLICHTLTLWHFWFLWFLWFLLTSYYMKTTKHVKNSILWHFWVKKTTFKKKVSVWHTLKWTSWLRPPKKSGSLHIMIFRYCGNILISVQSDFKIEKGVEKFMFGCHTLTHGTTLRRLPPVLGQKSIQSWVKSLSVFSAESKLSLYSVLSSKFQCIQYWVKTVIVFYLELKVSVYSVLS